MRIILLLCAVLFPGLAAFASGHGPVFGYATPTNSQGEWSFDCGLAGQNATPGTELMTRSMFTYGFTPQVQWSVSAPAILSTTTVFPSRMTAGSNFESDLGWRVYHNPDAIGRRFETTVYGGVIMPTPQNMGNMLDHLHWAPGFDAAVATGMASRSHYVWLGGGYARYLERSGDLRPDVLSYSLVYGYRPRPLRKDYPFWDWRVFGELTGENWSHVQMAGLAIPRSEGQQVFLGPTVLGIYKTFAISGGVQVPLYRDTGPFFARERVRFAINVSYFLFSSHQH